MPALARPCDEKRLRGGGGQGVGTFYTDPQIHSFDGRGFGAGNLGQVRAPPAGPPARRHFPRALAGPPAFSEPFRVPVAGFGAGKLGRGRARGIRREGARSAPPRLQVAGIA